MFIGPASALQGFLHSLHVLSILNDAAVLCEHHSAFDCIAGTLFCLQTAVSSVDIIDMLMVV